MFRKEFSDVISKTGMVPLKDLRPLLMDNAKNTISEFGLLNYAFFDDIKFAKVIANNYKLPYVNIAESRIADSMLKILRKSQIIEHRLLPIGKNAKATTVAIYDPSVMDNSKEIRALFQGNVEFMLTNLSAWKDVFERVTVSVEELVGTVREIKAGSVSEEENEQVDLGDIGDDVIYTVNKILADAFVRKVSDIHVEPYENRFRVRFRLDGTLAEVYEFPKNMKAPLISRLKIMAQLDISEKRKPQDGRIKLEIGGEPIDYRVSSLPTLFGEKVCLRLLDSSNLQLDMTKLGFEPKQIDIFKRNIHKPFGMCLVTGPTGSGKTTTLYSALAELNQIGVNISTAEDPCEFNLEGINQVNVRKEVGLTFAAALKAFLRQDPDIIMVGEIRDFETGEIAIEAALTGHMVLSTLHTNDAPSTVTRILNMGIEPFLVTGALAVCVAQRLCRRICSNCKERIQVSKEELVSAGYSPKTAEKVRVYEGKGCDACNGTGYKGRVAIYEVMELTPALRDMVLRHPSADDLKRLAIKEGMKTLRMSALTKVHEGATTIAEAVGNSSSDKL